MSGLVDLSVCLKGRRMVRSYTRRSDQWPDIIETSKHGRCWRCHRCYGGHVAAHCPGISRIPFLRNQANGSMTSTHIQLLTAPDQGLEVMGRWLLHENSKARRSFVVLLSSVADGQPGKAGLANLPSIMGQHCSKSLRRILVSGMFLSLGRVSRSRVS